MHIHPPGTTKRPAAFKLPQKTHFTILASHILISLGIRHCLRRTGSQLGGHLQPLRQWLRPENRNIIKEINNGMTEFLMKTAHIRIVPGK
jgi:hypothetical protein